MIFISIQIRTVLVIAFTNFIIILFSILAGTGYVRKNIESYIEADMMVVADIANEFISSELELLRAKADNITNSLMTSWDNWDLDWHLEMNPTFIGAAIMNADGILTSAGDSPASFDIYNNQYIARAFMGEHAFTSTVPTEDGVYIYLAINLPTYRLDSLLVLTLPGNYLSDMVAPFPVWETGHIFIDDREGYVIANYRTEWVENRQNFIHIAQTEPQYKELAAVISSLIQGSRGIGYYSLNGVERICAYRPISGSDEGWGLGIVAPLSESPIKGVDRGLFLIGIIGVCLNIIFAVIASRFVRKPFEEIATLKEAAEANSLAKSDFLANMSHEIRTPMNAILGIADIQLQDESLAQNTKEALYRIHQSADLLLGIINDILDLSKIEAGKLELMPDKYELASLINDTIALNLMRLGSKPLEFKLHIDDDTPSVLYGDVLRIKQVLNNLLSNAIKYTEKGKVVLSVKSEPMADTEIMLIFTVTDTGRGMTQEQINYLFDKYSRFNVDKNHTIEGTGLGMSIAHNLVSTMKGNITVQSELGKGSVFTVCLKQTDTGAGVLSPEVIKNLCRLERHTGKLIRKSHIICEPMPYGRVLVVDDVESNLYVAIGLLSPYKIAVETAMSGYDAIKKIKSSEAYDIVFIDHMMPGMDGVETVRHIRELGYHHPIVALTANAIIGQSDIFLANGFDGFVSKPIDIRHIDAVLKKFVRDRHPEKAKQTENQSAVPASKKSQNKQALSVKIARSFVRDAERVIETLSSLFKNNIHGDEQLHMITIQVHGMKSALLNVNEKGLSDKAWELEQAGRRKDIGFITAHLPGFLDELRNVAHQFSISNEDMSEEEIPVDYENLHKQLDAIIGAGNMYDKRSAKTLLSGLSQKAWPRYVKDRLHEMDDMLLSGDFDEMSQIAKDLLEWRG